MVYSYQLTSLSNVVLSVAPDAGGYEPALYVRRPNQCNSAEPSNQLACTAPLGGTATVSLGAQAPGTYFAWVDGTSSTSGAYTLTVTATAPQPGDVCATAGAAITAPVTLGMESLAGFLSDYSGGAGGCQFGNGPDRVYQIDIPAMTRLTVLATPERHRRSRHRPHRPTGHQLLQQRPLRDLRR